MSQHNMTPPPGYSIQVISAPTATGAAGYISERVLKKWGDDHRWEIGEQWQYKINKNLYNHITSVVVAVRRHLTQDEINEIKRKSNEAYYNQEYYFETERV